MKMICLLNCQLNEKSLFALFNKFEINEPTEILNYMYIVAVENTSILSFIELPFKNIKGEKQFLVLARDPKGRNGYLISLKEHDYEMNVIETELPEFTIERNRSNDIVLSDEKIKEELTKIENLNASQIEQFVSIIAVFTVSISRDNKNNCNDFSFDQSRFRPKLTTTK